jgi:hypothetical protein
MDDLERQMEFLRDRMQRTLSGAEGSGRRTVLDRFRNAIPGFAGRSAARNNGTSGKDAPEPAEPRPSEATPTPPDAGGGAQETTGAPEEEPRRGFFSKLFGG